MNQFVPAFEPSASADPIGDELRAGLDLQRAGLFGEAIEAYARALAIDPELVPAYVNAAACFAALGAVDEAVEWTSVALGLDPANAAAFANLGNVFEAQGRSEQAEAAWLKAVEIDPTCAEPFNNLGVVAARKGEAARAVEFFGRATANDPGRASFVINRAQTLLDAGRIDEARGDFEQALSIEPGSSEALSGLGRCCAALGDHAGARDVFASVVERDPGSSEAWGMLGYAELKLRNLDQATAALGRRLEIDPRDATAHRNLGLIAQDLGRFDMADLNLRRAIEIAPLCAETRYDHAAMLVARRFLPAALEAAEEALALFPDHLPLLRLKADVLRRTGDHRGALEICGKILEASPDDAEVLTEKGVLLDAVARHSEAWDAYERAIAIGGETAARVNLLGLSKREAGGVSEAVECFRRALALEPRAHGIRLNLAVTLGDMHRFDESEAEFARLIEESRDVRFLSSYLMAMHYNPARTREEIFAAHVRWAALYKPEGPSLRPSPRIRAAGEPLRVGFVSSGFHQHPVGAMITLGIENLPEDVEAYFYSNDPAVDAITHRLMARAKEWRMVHGLDDAAVERLIREDELDLLVDLSGHSAGNRLRVIAAEPAPVIAKWVGGLFNTSGMEAVDHLISDAVETPEEHDRFYTENVVRLPDDYICYLAPHYCPETGPLPAERNGYVTFGCFNNPTKVNPIIVEQWARILAAAPGSRLLLKHKQYAFEEFNRPIREIMAAHGVSEDRLIFEGAVPHDRLLAAYNRVDVALDPWPYSGGLTTCEALWMGAPVVSLPGPTFAGRHSATHLVAAGLADCVVEDWDGYRAKALALASDIPALASLRAGLRARVAASPLCDGPRFGRHLGEALHLMAAADGGLAVDRIRRSRLPAVEARGRVMDAIMRGLPETLEFSGEFGTELTGFLPYMHWLSDAGLLRDRKIRTYAGMACFYRDLVCAGIEEKHESREYVPVERRPDWLSIKDTHTFDGTREDSPFHRWPDMRAKFAHVAPFPEIAEAGRPLLVIHNKYCDEWDRGPINFIPCDVLDAMLSRLEGEHTVAYIRHGMAGPSRGYSADHNAERRFEDREVLSAHPDCLVFDDMFAAHLARGGAGGVNEMKGSLYARCRRFVSVQGGGANQLAFYGGSIVTILHRAGQESRWAYENGFFRFAANPAPMLMTVRSPEEILETLDAFANPRTVDGRAVPAEGSDALFSKFSPAALRSA